MKYDKEHKTDHGTIITSNTSTLAGVHRYNWEIKVDAPSTDQFNDISKVEYVLHPTFADPVRIATDRSNLFAMSSRGWGEFEIGVKIYFNDGKVEKLKHPLKLFGSEDPIK